VALKHSASNTYLAPRIPFWNFATKVCGINQPKTDDEEASKVQLTTGQRAVWKSYDRRVELTHEEGEAYREIAGKSPWKVRRKAPPFLLMTLTRGGGKSLLLATIAVYEAITNNYVAAPGETVAVVALAPLMRQAKDMLGYARAHLDRDSLAPLVDSMPANDIVLRNGRIIRVVAVDTDGGAARGPTYIAALFDESAYLGVDGKIVDADQWKAIIAGARGVSDFHGILSSTPNGEQGFFFKTFDENFGKSDTAWEVFHGPQPIMRPEMPPELLVEYERSDPEAWKREFLCDFKAGMGVEKFFLKAQIESCIQPGIIEIPPGDHTVQYVCAVDPTGGAHDLMTMTIVERLDDGTVRQCLARGWDPKAENSPTVHDMAREIADLVEPYGIKIVYGDVFGGAWVTEAFAAYGLEYETKGFGGPQKVQRSSLLRELFYTRHIELLDHPIQTKELIEYEKKTLSSGNVSVNHPMTTTGSDDFLDSLALATWELIGNDVKIHPPELLQKWDSKKWKKELFDGAVYPDISPAISDTAAKIIAKGEGPAWVIQNWSKDWRYCQCSLGELAWLCGVGPLQMVKILGKDTVLQLTWMRWILSYHRNDIDIILATHFVAIPGFEDVKNKISQQGNTERIVTYDCVGVNACRKGNLPGDWQPMAVKSKNTNIGVSSNPAFPPWEAPPDVWRMKFDVEKIYGEWPDRHWATDIRRAFRKTQ